MSLGRQTAARYTAQLASEVLEQFGRQRENDGRVLLGRDAAESLQVAQLQRRRGLVDDVRSIFERPSCSVLALSSDHLQKTRNRFVNLTCSVHGIH